MIKDHNSVPSKEARMGDIHKRKLQVLVWWRKYHQRRGIVFTEAAWTTADLTGSITQINIESL